jgi:hypothetical protein
LLAPAEHFLLTVVVVSESLAHDLHVFVIS